MLRDTAKTAAAVAFLLLLAVPVAFFRFGYVGALREALLTIALFALTAFFGHRYVRTFLGIASPTTLDARILVGLALTTVFLAFGDIYLFLGSVTGSILSGLQFAFLTGLLSSSLKSQTGGWSSWKRGFWKRPEYIPAMILMAVVSIAMVALFWSRLHWWSVLVVPVMFLGNRLAEIVGQSVRQWILALRQVWSIARRMGPPIGAFTLGYLVIAGIFAALFASAWRADSTAFKGLSPQPSFIDFAYYSVMTISTTGYGDVVPESPAAKLLASTETLVGLAWTIVIFAAVLTVVQTKNQSQQGGGDDNDQNGRHES